MPLSLLKGIISCGSTCMHYLVSQYHDENLSSITERRHPLIESGQCIFQSGDCDLKIYCSVIGGSRGEAAQPDQAPPPPLKVD